MDKKFFGVILSALLLSACAADDITEISETASETSVTSETLPTTSETTSATALSEWIPGNYQQPSENENENSVTFVDDEFFIANYFNEHNLRYSDRTIYVDMDDFPDNDYPFENLNENYISHADMIVLSNADGRNINFVNIVSPHKLAVSDYSGECDFSNIKKEI